MTVVQVQASRSYEVLIGEGLLKEAGERIRAVTRAGTAVIVAGDIVWPSTASGSPGPWRPRAFGCCPM